MLTLSYPDHVHLDTVVEESPELGAHLLPGLGDVLEPLELLKGCVGLVTHKYTHRNTTSGQNTLMQSSQMRTSRKKSSVTRE